MDPLRKASDVLTAKANPDELFEKHFTPQELAECWKFSVSTILRMFQDEPGVFKVGKSRRRDGKRDYVTLRIPESVARRVYCQKISC